MNLVPKGRYVSLEAVSIDEATPDEEEGNFFSDLIKGGECNTSNDRLAVYKVLRKGERVTLEIYEDELVLVENNMVEAVSFGPETEEEFFILENYIIGVYE